VTANGTAPGSVLTTGAAAGWPERPIPKMSMALVLALVVTMSWLPSGEKATWPGVWMN
jgi:hypothetical protein